MNELSVVFSYRDTNPVGGGPHPYDLTKNDTNVRMIRQGLERNYYNHALRINAINGKIESLSGEIEGIKKLNGNVRTEYSQ